MKLKSNEIAHLDNNFFVLTARQAKKLCVENILPAHGMQRRANLDVLRTFSIGSRRRDGDSFRPWRVCITGNTEAWVTRTPCSYLDGAPTARGWVWAVSLRNYYVGPSI